MIIDWGNGTPTTDLKEYCKKKRLDITKSTKTHSDGISILFVFSPDHNSIFKKPLYYREYFSFDDNEPISEFHKRALSYLERKEEEYE